ncbi:KIN17-like protein [Camellia sinensis]|uniref:KIN17-like protein n=1 Tax=Camellia sinensis TaxID=4442 RepID=UPI001035EA07|nr:KIN17-like protein [Camellia sinensis]
MSIHITYEHTYYIYFDVGKFRVFKFIAANHRNRALNQSILRLGTQKAWFRLRISVGKNEFLTPKAIANRIKAKGLQKLRWYCQMCQKQCRDENGFKCHCMSESHQRQMEVFGQNPHRIVDGYSKEFEREFLDHIKCSHCFSRIATTVVYNEYIADRHHIHMNSTQWATLTEFVKYLGRTGKCKVDETPKGWFITYIDRDSETLFKEKLKCKRTRADLIDEEKQEREIRRQIERFCFWMSTRGGRGRVGSRSVGKGTTVPLAPALITSAVGEEAAREIVRVVRDALACNERDHGHTLKLTMEFLHSNPPEFLGEPKSLEVEDWLEQIPKTLDMLRVEDEELRVNLAGFQLKGDVGY